MNPATARRYGPGCGFPVQDGPVRLLQTRVVDDGRRDLAGRCDLVVVLDGDATAGRLRRRVHPVVAGDQVRVVLRGAAPVAVPAGPLDRVAVEPVSADRGVVRAVVGVDPLRVGLALLVVDHVAGDG